MSRSRTVNGKYVKITNGDHNMSSEGHIISKAVLNVGEKGTAKGVTRNNYERLGSNVNEDFEIIFSLEKGNVYSTLVPMGILDFEGKYENANFVFNYSLMLSNIDSLDFKILNEDGSTLYAVTNLPEVVISARRMPLLVEDIFKKKPKYDPFNPKNVWDWKSVFGPYNVSSNDYTKIGSYVILWDGFDNNEIYDSTNFNNKKLKAQITATKNGNKKTKEVEFSTEQIGADWVDVKIDKKNKRIDTTLRVNLKDGGEEGLKCFSYHKMNPYDNETKTECPWDKIPKSEINPSQPIIKARTRSFEDLKQLAFAGLEHYWGRNKSRIFGNSVNINGSYEVFIHATDSNKNALNAIPLVYNTNGDWMRSGNPGGSYSDGNLDDDAMDLLPDLGVIQRLSYNVGYIYEYHFLKTWEYQTENDEDIEFKETAAHELGHELLQAYGGTVYSWQHKGSSYYLPQDTKPTKGSETIWDKTTHWDEMDTDGENYSLYGEIDVMKYYNKELRVKDRSRMIAAEKDVVGLFWLTKLKIK